MHHFADRLLQACRDKGAPVCVGIDPVYERLPGELRDDVPADDARLASEVIKAYCERVLDAVCPHVPVVKFQSACFERYLWHGSEVLHRLIDRARAMGLIVILDAKRGDIGISSAHYAAADLGDLKFTDIGDLAGPDALTVNSYLGADGIEPFIETAANEGKGLFALVRTSNPGSDQLQTVETKDAGRVVDVVAKMIAEAGARDGLVGERGYSLLGAVVGATKPEDAAGLRELMPQQIFLVPGFGAQGGGADDVKACFRDDGSGAIITSSRGVIYAYDKTPGLDWQQAVESAAKELNAQIAAVLADR